MVNKKGQTLVLQMKKLEKIFIIFEMLLLTCIHNLMMISTMISIGFSLLINNEPIFVHIKTELILFYILYLYIFSFIFYPCQNDK